MARERYLLHTGDEEIHNQKKEIKLVTKKDKWSNFWYYHKKHVIIGIVLVALLGMFIMIWRRRLTRTIPFPWWWEMDI